MHSDSGHTQSIWMDTAEVPESGPTVASRTTMIVGGVIARAVAVLSDRVLSWQGGSAVRDCWIESPDSSRERFRENGH